jgi:integrase
MVQQSLQEYRLARLLIAFGTKDVRHARGSIGAHGRRLAARCLQLLAGHRSIQTTQRYIDGDAFDVDGHTIIFKIDYLDQTMSMRSPDPADPSVTQRVISIMLAEEY